MVRRSVYWVLWVALLASSCAIVRGFERAEDASTTPVHAADASVVDADSVWTPVTATPVQPPCSEITQEKLTKFSLFNMVLQRRCQDQSGGVNAFPFDVAPSREQLVRLSASPACLVVSKGVLRLVEHECILGDFRMPIRATAETVLKLHEDRKDLATYPIPADDVLQQQIVQRARMNNARDVDPIGFSANQYPPEMQQYETQLTKAYASGGIILLSIDFKVLNDLSTIEQQVGSEAASAAVAELVDTTTLAPALAPASMSSTGSNTDNTDSSAGSEHEVDVSSSSGSHSSFRAEPSREGSASGSLTDAAAVVKPQTSGASPCSSVKLAATAISSVILVLL